MTLKDIRCPDDHKFWFAASPSNGLVEIKCRGECKQFWHIHWNADEPVITLANPQPAR